MSVLFQKTLVDVCQVLDSREGLTYPFDLGNWSEIRVGVELSYIAITGAGYNTVPGFDEAQGGTSLTNSFLMGFRNTNTTFPDTTNGFHIGFIGNNLSVSALISEGRIRRTPAAHLPIGIILGPTTVAVDLDSSSRTVYTAGTSASAATVYAAQHGFRVRLTGQGTTGQFLTLDTFNNTTAYVTPSVTGLRAFMGVAANSVSGAYYPLTSGFVSNGGPLTFPNAFFLYSPFLSGSLRVHTLIVDRYA